VRVAAGSVDVLALTDHDEIRGALAARAFARANPELGVDVVIGEEITTRNGHLLGLFLEERVPPGLPASRTIELVHAQGGVAIVAHPFHPINSRGRGARPLARLIPDLPLDAVEVVNNAGFFSWLYDAWAALHNVEWRLPVTGASDAHDVWYLASGLTRFDGDRAEDLRRALLEGRTRAQARWRWTADKAPRHIAFQVRAGLRFLKLALRGVRPGLQPRAARAILNETLRLRHRSVVTRG
jgi:predicted metal-dependent phosphoesterase TrpH